MLESGTILTKKRHSNSPNHTFGEVYIDDKVFTVKKSVYEKYHVGDVVDYSYTNHVSFSGVQFHNLIDINLTERNSVKVESKKVVVDADHLEIKFYDAQTSKFFFWINVVFVSFIIFFVEMYFLARFNLDTQFQTVIGAKFFLPKIFFIFFTMNFISFTPLLRKRKFKKLMSLEKTILQFPVIEFIQEQDSDVCVLFYRDNSQIQQLEITMDNFHQIKRHQLVEITFLNHHSLYNIVGI
jgi:hypothetical protein